MSDTIHKIQNHRKDLIEIIHRSLKDKLSRYQRALEISEQTLKVSKDTLYDNHVDKLLRLLKETMPSDSLSTLELIKGALLQSQIMKSSIIPRVLKRGNNQEEEKDNKNQEEQDHQLPKKKVHIEERLEQSKQKLDNQSSCKKTEIQTQNSPLSKKDNESSKDVIPQLQLSIKTEEKENNLEKTPTPELNQLTTQASIQPIQYTKIENNQEEENLLFQKHIERISSFEKTHDMQLPDKFKQKELFLMRLQNPNQTSMRFIDEKDKEIIVKLANIFQNIEEIADLLQLRMGIIKRIVYDPYNSAN